MDKQEVTFQADFKDEIGNEFHAEATVNIRELTLSLSKIGYVLKRKE